MPDCHYNSIFFIESNAKGLLHRNFQTFISKNGIIEETNVNFLKRPSNQPPHPLMVNETRGGEK